MMLLPEAFNGMVTASPRKVSRANPLRNTQKLQTRKALKTLHWKGKADQTSDQWCLSDQLASLLSES